MSTVRRRVLRPPRGTAPDPQKQLQIEKRRTKLELERASLDRWMLRMKRAFHAFEKQQHRVSRLERQIRQLEQA
jgi:hypothetical protein